MNAVPRRYTGPWAEDIRPKRKRLRMNKRNIYIEGIPGSGKTTVLDRLGERLTGYRLYHEGDISPAELAWCAYMTKADYEEALLALPGMAQAITEHTMQEGEHFIVAYTKIHAQDMAFYQYMERFELYGGRRDLEQFKKIIYGRTAAMEGSGYLFECAFFQNVLEELMLFSQYEDVQILEFYKEWMTFIDMESFFLIRLKTSNIRESILHIKEERVNGQGEEEWYSLMLSYLQQSPYGMRHCFRGLEDVIGHFERRMDLEDKIMDILPEKNRINIESKNYDLEWLLRKIVT